MSYDLDPFVMDFEEKSSPGLHHWCVLLTVMLCCQVRMGNHERCIDRAAFVVKTGYSVSSWGPEKRRFNLLVLQRELIRAFDRTKRHGAV